MSLDQKAPTTEAITSNISNYHPAPSLVDEFSARAGSLDYDKSMRSSASRAHTNEAALARPHHLMRLQTISLSELRPSKSTELPFYSLGRPFPDPHNLRRRSRSRLFGDISATMNIQTPSLHNIPISCTRPLESSPPLAGVEVTSNEMPFLALDNLPEGHCIIATPALLRSFVEETRNRHHGARHYSINGTDPRQSTHSSHHRNAVHEYQDTSSTSLAKPQLISSTLDEKTEKELQRASHNSHQYIHEVYDQDHGILPASAARDFAEKPTHSSRYLRFKSIIREPAAEALASFLLAVFSGGASAQVYLTANSSVSASPKGNYATQCIGGGIGVMTGVYVAGGISGGHLNPIVTLALAIFRKFPWNKVIPYWCAQIVGGLVGAATIQMIYASGLDVYEGGVGVRTFTGPSSTAGFFINFPAEYMSNIGSFFQEFLDSAIILLFIMAIGDRENSPPPDGISPVVFMCVVIGIAFSLGSQTSYATNPALDVASRIVASLMGYGNAHWAYRDQYWLWNNWFSNIAGALFGCFMYDFFIYEGDDSPLNRPWSWNPRTRLISMFRRKSGQDQKTAGGNGEQFV